MLTYILSGCIFGIVSLVAAWAKWDAQFLAACCAVGAATILFKWLTSSRSPKPPIPSKENQVDGQFASYSDPIRVAAAGSTNAPFHANGTAEVFETEFCSTKVLFMHRPTHEPWRDKANDYPFAWHFSGKQRRWEIRAQMQFKKIPEGRMFVGLALDRYVKVGKKANWAMGVVVASCRSIIKDLYHSFGDDPTKMDPGAEVEPHTFVMPFWAFDQMVVSELGEEPDVAGDLEGLGTRRTQGVKEYIRLMDSTLENLSTDKVYTFCIWGLSQFADWMTWEICGGKLLAGTRLSLNQVVGDRPILVTIYALEEDNNAEYRRHVASRKQDCLQVAFWSDTGSGYQHEISGEARARTNPSTGASKTTPCCMPPTAWFRKSAKQVA
jgi:hypothetical protein